MSPALIDSFTPQLNNNVPQQCKQSVYQSAKQAITLPLFWTLLIQMIDKHRSSRAVTDKPAGIYWLHPAEARLTRTASQQQEVLDFLYRSVHRLLDFTFKAIILKSCLFFSLYLSIISFFHLSSFYYPKHHKNVKHSIVITQGYFFVSCLRYKHQIKTTTRTIRIYSSFFSSLGGHKMKRRK